MRKLPVVKAKNMVTAQAYTPTTEDLVLITDRADFFESIGLSREVYLRVEDAYMGATIGHLVYNA